MSSFETSDDAFKKANKFFVEEEYEKALQHYSDAIELNTDDNLFAEFYEKRSTCNYQLENFSDAIEDADKALKYNPKSVAALLRKGMSYFALDEYESAKCCLEEGLKVDPKHSKLSLWLKKTNAELNAEKQAPIASQPMVPQPQAAPQQQQVAAPQVQQQAQPQPPPSIKSRIKVQHYQNAREVVVDILGMKEVPVANRSVKLEDTRVTVTIKLPDEDYVKEIPLYSEINAAESIVNHTSMKIELVLKKKVKNMEWPTLEQSQASARHVNTLQQGSSSSSNIDPRKYPSSKGSVNWDALESNIAKEKDEEGDPLTKLFQQIYKDANEDTRRAMMKSFSESGGTVLSTNWKEVGKEKVKVQAPQGMEPRKWDE